MHTFTPVPVWNVGRPESKVIRASKRCDVVMTAGHYVVNALALKKPVVFYALGADMTQLPFDTRLGGQWLSYLHRRRIRTVNCILSPQDEVFWAARLLGVQDKMTRYAFPVDVDAISAGVDRELLAELESRYRQYDSVFFCPSRKNLDPTVVDYKASEKFLEAFHRFVARNGTANVRLVIGMHGHHVSEYGQILDQLGLRRYCDFVGQLSLPQLHAYMCLRNVVLFDQYGTRPKGIGGIAREAVSLGCMVVTSVASDSPEFLEAFGPECPVLDAFETHQIAQAIEEVLGYSPEKREAVRKRSQRWAYRYLHWESRIDQLIDILQEASQEGRSVSRRSASGTSGAVDQELERYS